MSKFKIGDLVRVTYDGTTHTNQVGRILNQDGTKDYPNDYWIEFESGCKAPYGDYELALVTSKDIDAMEKILRQRRDYLMCGNWSPIKKENTNE